MYNEAPGTSVTFIIHGNASDKAKASLTDARLLSYFKEADSLPEEEKATVIKVVAALIQNYKTAQLFAG